MGCPVAWNSARIYLTSKSLSGFVCAAETGLTSELTLSSWNGGSKLYFGF